MEIRSLLEAYYELSSLKFEEHWNKNMAFSRRKESIAEAVYGAQQWAWILWSELSVDVDIFKVIAILSLSEISRTDRFATMFLGSDEKGKKFDSLILEWQKSNTKEARFARLCKKLNSNKRKLEGVNKEEVKEIFAVYNTLNILKKKIRQGIINWNITGIRRESIAEHVYSVQQLAWLMWMYTSEEVDIFKIIGMLSIHEVEETIIGDITPYSGVTPEQKLEMGKAAVKKVLGNLKQYEAMHSYINEFDDEKTANAFFAHLCDKLDCDLTVKYYSDGGYCSIKNATDAMKNNPKIQKLIANGAKTVADAFIMADEHMYVGSDFEKVIEYVKKHDVISLLS